MTIDLTVQPMTWAQAVQTPRMSPADARAAAAAERAQQEREAQAAEDARHEHCGAFHHGSCATDDYMRHEIARLRAELARAEQERDHWYMKANHNDIELATYARRRAALPAELRRQDAEAQHAQHVAHAA